MSYHVEEFDSKSALERRLNEISFLHAISPNDFSVQAGVDGSGWWFILIWKDESR